MDLNKDYSLQIILSTYPLNQRDNFKEKISKDFIEKFKKDYTEDRNNLEGYYEPVSFHLFGSFDIAFISAIENFKLVQKVLIPKTDIDKKEAIESDDNNNETGLMHPGNYQTLTGILVQSTSDTAKEEIERLKSSKYVVISNLKFNSGYSIGNGLEYQARLAAKISEIHKSIDDENLHFSLMISFSWAEFILVTYGPKINMIIDFLKEIRRLKLSDIDSDMRILENSTNYLLHKPDNLSLEETREKWKNSHVLSDTHSFTGTNYEKFEEHGFDDKDLKKAKIQVEWSLKPGYLGDFLTAFETDFETSIIPEHVNILTGKTDFSISADVEPGKKGAMLMLSLTKSKGMNNEGKKINDYKDFVRKQKTRILFTTDDLDRTPLSGGRYHPPRFNDSFVFSEATINKLNESLKAIKLSRHVREKILKIFINYNNGINDSILFTYFIDLSAAVQNLAEKILENKRKLDNLLVKPFIDTHSIHLSVKNTEEDYQCIINVFEEGHQVRIMNSYVYEEADDFDLDLNSSINQLLTNLNSIVYILSDVIHDGPFKFVPIISFNLKNTVGNIYSINFGLHEIISPEFIFFTVQKEICNVFFETSGQGARSQFNKLRDDFFGAFEKSKRLDIHQKLFIWEMKENQFIKFEYLFNELLRYELILNKDIELFWFWSWTYNLQNSSLYGIIGVMDEDHFKKELFRTMFIYDFYDKEKELSKLTCPVPELENYWFRYFHEFRKILNKTKKERKDINKKLKDSIKGIVEKHSSKYRGLKFPRNPQKSKDYDFNALMATFLNQKILDSASQYIHMLEKKESDSDSILKYFEDEINDNPYKFIITLMYGYLKEICNKNHGKVGFLQRNWKDGVPNKVFLEHCKSYFLSDPFGGVFFKNTADAKEYFVFRNKIILLITMFSQITKKEMISEIKRRKKEFDIKSQTATA